jgi:uncharacterized DUF497 family protein
MKKSSFEWDENKNKENQTKHNVSFSLAQYAFLDPHRIIAEDFTHSMDEERFYCIGRVDNGIMTRPLSKVRFQRLGLSDKTKELCDF